LIVVRNVFGDFAVWPRANLVDNQLKAYVAGLSSQARLTHTESRFVALSF
jgi:hypothetical protein